MIYISPTNIITMHRGDTGKVEFFLNAGNCLEDIPAEILETDTIYFGVMEYNELFENAIVRKKLPGSAVVDGKFSVYFDSKDTENLYAGTYYYEIKLRTFVDNQEHIQTIMPKRIFNLLD